MINKFLKFITVFSLWFLQERFYVLILWDRIRLFNCFITAVEGVQRVSTVWTKLPHNITVRDGRISISEYEFENSNKKMEFL